MTSALPIDVAMRDARLLGAALGPPPTWLTWLAILKAAHGRLLNERERELFAAVAGGREPPRRKVKELVAIASRRSGKGRVAAALAVHAALLTDHSKVLAPGEVGVVACVSPTRAQAAILLDYARGYLDASPLLRDEVRDVTSDEIRLKNGNVICTLTSDYRSVRGRTLLLACMDEAAFLRDEMSSTPDIECARALRPGLATTNGLLCILSSPYRKAGLLFERHRRFFGKSDADVLVIQAPSKLLNPTLDAGMIANERQTDAFAAQSEWLGEFRSDLASFLDDALIERAVDHDRPLELAPRGDFHYRAFVDASGGVGADSYTISVAHRAGEEFVVDLVQGTCGQFDPQEVTKEYAALVKQYRIGSVTGDAYGSEWVSAAWRNAGVSYMRSELPKSQIYLECVPLFTRGLVRLPDHPKLLRELRLLERRTHRSGRDTVDHPRGVHDDLANVCCGVLRSLSNALSVYAAMDWVSGPDTDRAAPAETVGGVHSIDLAVRPHIGPPLPRQWRSPYWQ
jgi:hypothetical protein